MTQSIRNLNTYEIALACGGVTEGPDGKGCTEHGDMPGTSGLPDLLDLGPAGPTIEIDMSI
ncbi:hypothetical protein FGU71_05065 [Erythrobacter insulae]|uniref:Uncharacterized protein n=1 Tax=Erythrobacter insulae TaxID=2584124 RepID=A0A547PAV2_9SPHN|nr:hypothetical protein [Erythrobacter insulae]TRD11278.1 hypothetical protein FGU71_05065 [Erythrobacter insulae]